MSNNQALFVEINGNPSAEEDGHVPGVYRIEFEPDSVQNVDRASVALDVIAENVAISCLDDFQLVVLDLDGDVLFEEGDRESYTMGHLGVFVGRVVGEELPDPVLRTLQDRLDPNVPRGA